MTMPSDPMKKPGGAQPYAGQPAAPYAGQPGAPYAQPGAPYAQPGTPPAPQQGRGLKQGPGWAVYAITVLALVLLTAVVVFIVQNTIQYQIKFFGWTGYVSLAAAIGLAALAGLLVGLIVGFILQLPLRKRLKMANKQAAQAGTPRT
jgi:uncharacterized integral membrane protein